MKKLFHRRCHNNDFFSRFAHSASAAIFTSDFCRFLPLLSIALYAAVSPFCRRNKNRIHWCCFFLVCLRLPSTSANVTATTEALVYFSLPLWGSCDDGHGGGLTIFSPQKYWERACLCVRRRVSCVSLYTVNVHILFDGGLTMTPMLVNK